MMNNPTFKSEDFIFAKKKSKKILWDARLNIEKPES